ncbi:MAG: pseudouridine synthase [Gammaproteobacteria bacterium]
MHRLDCSTGVMVLAKTKVAQSELNRQFRDRETGKEYIAVGFGECESDTGEIDFPLITDWPNRPRQMICYEHSKKPSLTRYEVLQRNAGQVRLHLIPVTGRSHPLRVHCMAIGLPLLGGQPLHRRMYWP